MASEQEPPPYTRHPLEPLIASMVPALVAGTMLCAPHNIDTTRQLLNNDTLGR